MLQQNRHAANCTALTPPSSCTLPVLLQLLVECPLRRQKVKPEAKLTHANLSIKPKEATVEPLLDPRDCLPGGRVAYRLVLTYGFNVTEGGKYKPCVPLTNRCGVAAVYLC